MKFYDVGFTGTQDGMSTEQQIEIHMLLGDLQAYARASTGLHGMCVGADAQFHELAKALGYRIVGYPGLNRLGEVEKRATMVCDVERRPQFFLDRNYDMTLESHVMLATPKQMQEVKRSGTWMTIRAAKRLDRPTVVVYPDGSSAVTGLNGVTDAVKFRHELARLR